MRALAQTDTVLNARWLAANKIGFGQWGFSQYWDDWLRPVRIMLDGDHDGKIKLGDEVITNFAPSPIIVWSLGPNAKDDNGTNDDINSWEPLDQQIHRWKEFHRYRPR